MPSSLTVRLAQKSRMELQELTCSRTAPALEAVHPVIKRFKPDLLFQSESSDAVEAAWTSILGEDGGVLSRALAGGVCEVGPRVGRESVGARETCLRDFDVPSTTLPQYDSQVLLSGEVLS